MLTEWSSPSVITFSPISESSFFVMSFQNHNFLLLTFPISLLNLTTEPLSKNLTTKLEKLMTEKNI